MSRNGALSSLVALPVLLGACNAIVGMEDVTLVASDAGGSDGGDSGADARPDGGTFALTGVAHFVQPGTKLRIKNGTDSVDVSANGPFSLPRVAQGSTYDVKVEILAGDQACDVAGGSGTANADVGGVVVTCLVAKEVTSAVATGQSYTTTAGSYVDFDAAAPLTITVDAEVATKALVMLSAPQIGAPYNGVGGIGILIDGKPVAESIFEDVVSGAGVPSAAYAIVDVTAGSHVVSAKWRTWRLDSPPQPAQFDRGRSLRLGAMLLGSIPSVVDAVSATATQSSGLNLTGLPATEAMAVKTTLSASAPLLALGMVPLLGNQSVPMQGVQGALDLDGDRFRTQHVSSWGDRNTITTVGLTPKASAGSHTLVSLAGAITAENWAKGDAAAKLPLTVRHDLVAWRSGTFATRVAATGDRTISSSSFTDVDATATLSFSPTHDTIALVVLHQVATWSTGSGNTGELAVDVDGSRVGTSGVTSTRPLARGSNAPTFLLLRLPAGPHALKPTFRSRGDGAEGSANVFHIVDASLSLIALN